MIALDVPTWLIEYSENLNWSNYDVEQSARDIIAKYMMDLPMKSADYSARPFIGRTPSDVVETISGIDWKRVSWMQQQAFQLLLR